MFKLKLDQSYPQFQAVLILVDHVLRGTWLGGLDLCYLPRIVNKLPFGTTLRPIPMHI